MLRVYSVSCLALFNFLNQLGAKGARWRKLNQLEMFPAIIPVLTPQNYGVRSQNNFSLRGNPFQLSRKQKDKAKEKETCQAKKVGNHSREAEALKVDGLGSVSGPAVTLQILLGEGGGRVARWLECRSLPRFLQGGKPPS